MGSAGYTGVRVIHELFSNNSFRPLIANVVRAIHGCGQYTDPFSKSSLGAGYTRCAGYTRVRAIFANLRYTPGLWELDLGVDIISQRVQISIRSQTLLVQGSKYSPSPLVIGANRQHHVSIGLAHCKRLLLIIVPLENLVMRSKGFTWVALVS